MVGCRGVAVAFTVGWFLSWFFSTTLSATIRYAGTTLQLLGLVTVAIGLSQMRQLFGRPSVSAAVVGWFGRLANAFTVPEPITGEGFLAAGHATLTGKGRVVHGIKPGAPLEERVSVLEKNLDLLRDELDAEVDRLQRKLTAVEASIDREKQVRQEEDAKTVRRIEEVAVGGLHLETVGLFWLILGVVATGIPDVITAWLSLGSVRVIG